MCNIVIFSSHDRLLTCDNSLFFLLLNVFSVVVRRSSQSADEKDEPSLLGSLPRVCHSMSSYVENIKAPMLHHTQKRVG